MASDDIEANTLCNTVPSVPTGYSAFLPCAETGRYATLQKTSVGHWDLNEFEANIKMPPANECSGMMIMIHG